jgi:hypothetical protein
MSKKFLALTSIVFCLATFSALFVRAQAKTKLAPAALPDNPAIDSQGVELVSHLGGANYAVQAVGNALYVGMGPELAILDATNPAAPVRVGYAILPGTVCDIDVAGNIAYVANIEAGLQIVDLSDPAHPAVIGSLDTPGEARAVSFSNGYAYVADGDAGLRVIDVSNPYSPQEVANFPTADWALDVVATGQHVYLAAWYAGVYVLDVTNPLAPAEIGSIHTVNEAIAIKVLGTTAYIAAASQGFRIFDVSSPALPVELGYLDDIGDTRNLAIAWPYAYVDNQDYGELYVIDTTQPTNPILLGAYWAEYPFTSKIAVIGQYTFLARGAWGLDIVNVANPATPSQAGAYGTTGVVYRMAMEGDYLYAAAKRLQVIGIANPAAPVEFGKLFEYDPDYSASIAVNGNYAYSGNILYDSLNIIDIADPAHPTSAGSFTLRGKMLDIDTSSHYAFVCASYPDDGIQILDIANPLVPVEVSYYASSGGYGCGIDVQDNYALIVQDTELKILDVTDPSAPSFVGNALLCQEMPPQMCRLSGITPMLLGAAQGAAVSPFSISRILHHHKRSPLFRWPIVQKA